jgi:hypothetical protein
VKPEDSWSERSHDPAPDGTVAHPAAAGLWEQLLSRGNLAEALRRVEQNAGAPGIDGMRLKRVLVGGSLSARGGRLPAAAC